MSDAVERVLSMHDRTASERLVYLALRDADGALTPAEAAERVGLSEHTTGRALGELADDGWAESITRPTEARGRDPTEYRPLVACPECGERFVGDDGVKTHLAHCGDTVTAYDLQDEDVGPEDFGLGSETPEPTGGLR